MTVRPDQLDMADSKGQRDIVECLDRRVAGTFLQSADVLLAKVGALSHLFLRHTTGGAQAREVPPDQFAHVHAQAI